MPTDTHTPSRAYRIAVLALLGVIAVCSLAVVFKLFVGKSEPAPYTVPLNR